jgi:hypothetical protein
LFYNIILLEYATIPYKIKSRKVYSQTIFLVFQAMVAKSEASEQNPSGLKVQNKVGTLGVVSGAAESSSEGEGDSIAAEAPVMIRRLGKHHFDKSVAGGGVIKFARMPSGRTNPWPKTVVRLANGQRVATATPIFF